MKETESAPQAQGGKMARARKGRMGRGREGQPRTSLLPRGTADTRSPERHPRSAE